jgi:hypothetical protein
MCVCGGVCILVAAGALGGGAFGAGAVAKELGNNENADGGAGKATCCGQPDDERSRQPAQTLWDPFWGYLESLANGVAPFPAAPREEHDRAR